MTARAPGRQLAPGYEDLVDDDDDCDTGVMRARFEESKRAIDKTREQKLGELKARIAEVGSGPTTPKP